MEEDENTGQGLNDALLRFEEDIKYDNSSFFDLSDILEIYDHYHLKGEEKKAIFALSVAKSQHPYSADPYLREAEMHLYFNNYLLAKEVLSKAKILEPNNEDILQIEVDCLIKEGKERKALDMLYKALPETEDKSFIYASIAEICMEKKWYAEEIKCYKEWLKVDQVYFVYFDMASCFIKMNDLDEGINLFSGYIDEDPYNMLLWSELGRLYEEKEDYHKAIWAYEYSTIIEEDYDGGYINMANCYYMLDDMNNMKLQLDIAKSLNDHNAELYLSYGKYYKEVSNYSTAKKHLLKAIDLEDTNHQSWLELAILYKELGAYEDAHPYFKTAYRLCPQDTDIIVDYLFTEGMVNGVEGAHLWYLDAKQWMADFAPMFETMALIFSAEHLYEDAAKVLLQDFNPKDLTAQGMYILAGLHYAIKSPKLAEGYLMEALSDNYKEHKLLFEVNPKLEFNEEVIELINLFRNE